MSTGPRQRTVCQACGARCQATPLQHMLFVDRPAPHWVYLLELLCPPCRVARLDELLCNQTSKRTAQRSHNVIRSG